MSLRSQLSCVVWRGRGATLTTVLCGGAVLFCCHSSADVEGYGVIVSGKKKRVETNTFVEPACSLLASNSSEARAKVTHWMVDMMPHSM